MENLVDHLAPLPHCIIVCNLAKKGSLNSIRLIAWIQMSKTEQIIRILFQCFACCKKSVRQTKSCRKFRTNL